MKKLETLFEILSQCRGAGSEYTTMSWIQSNLLTVDFKFLHDKKGKFMFAYCDIGDSVTNTTVFTCHLDTVEGESVGRKPVTYDSIKNQCFSPNRILGADDGTGIAVLMYMIRNGVSGRYFFFAGEERGGIGSTYLVDNHPELIMGYLRAIAFDRAGVSDVIVSQSTGECCSRQFAVALCDQLGAKFVPANGVYTDTAEFVGIIPECTNISVGYYHQHGIREYQDVGYYEWLCDKVCEIDWEGLPVFRDPMEYSFTSYTPQKYNDKILSYIVEDMMAEGLTLSDLLDYIKKEGMYELI